MATDFTPIDDLFKRLEIGPYEYLRHFSFKRFMEAYWQYFVCAAIFIIGLILHGIRSEYLVNKRTHALTESLRRERKLRAESALVKGRLDKIQKVGESIGVRGEPPELKHLSRARKRNQPRFRK